MKLVAYADDAAIAVKDIGQIISFFYITLVNNNRWVKTMNLRLIQQKNEDVCITKQESNTHN